MERTREKGCLVSIHLANDEIFMHSRRGNKTDMPKSVAQEGFIRSFIPAPNWIQERKRQFKRLISRDNLLLQNYSIKPVFGNSTRVVKLWQICDGFIAMWRKLANKTYSHKLTFMFMRLQHGWFLTKLELNFCCGCYSSTFRIIKHMTLRWKRYELFQKLIYQISKGYCSSWIRGMVY